MIKHFYSYHVETDSLVLEINSLEIEDHEKEHLTRLAESQIHHSIVHALMAELAREDKKIFLNHLNAKDHTRLWKFLNARIEKAEEKIRDAADKIKHELLKDIAELKNKKEG